LRRLAPLRTPVPRSLRRRDHIAYGRLVEEGSHDELVALGGHYAELWSVFVESGRPAALEPAG